MKKCSKCGLEKSLKNFRLYNKSKSGRKSICKECESEYNKKCDEKARSKYGIGIATIKFYGLEVALKVYDRAGRKCEACGSENDLTIHHKDHNGRNKFNIGEKMNNDVNNLQVLCRSCHGSYHAKKYWEDNKDIQHKIRKLQAGWIEKNGKWFKTCKGCKRFLEVNQDNFNFRKNGAALPLCRKCSAQECRNRRDKKKRR